MADNLLKSQAFKLKGRLYTFTVLQLLSRDRSLFEQQLIEIVAKAPRLFDRTPVVLDCSALEDGEIDLQSFCQCMRENHLLPVAVQGANSFLNTLAQCQGLAVLNASSSHDKPLLEEQETAVESIKTKLLTTPVRSGQQVVSKGGDLVITASVSHGAELLADGNIHIYGALRGRALAGISGDKQARIFCQSLDAELVSIAGFYRLSDAIEPYSGPCQIFLQDEHIQIEPLC
ncbi:septum site-determining protein MinC [Legionella jamestowniensis]|uniref:Probable septum site-determining protein MinC n=1 Tax=Legionella jamestowniensis TaxID=455 RepID=A0A0W0UJU1_9GAMM|nr:septum site-determining protein MinC [Legionella jamestowniensis]KTD08174.1 septum site determining protein MinC [Legionella jamestowniensis]OCH98499.1 septum site-determining protein MinC [Legionella jamestowniensis]SFL98945.1 septum site-determining protein MinC [Legionella jamestowniensis DSM 19215]